MINKLKCALCLNGLFLGCIYVSSYAQLIQQKHSTSATPQQANSNLSKWTDASWTNNNVPYQKIRQVVDAAIEKKQITVKTLDLYQSEFQKSQKPTLALFKWAYASYAASKQSPPILQDLEPGAGLFDELPDPHTYDYTRLRFLYDVPGKDEELLPLARRLIKKDSKDYFVIYSTVRMFSADGKGLTKSQALSYATRLVSLYPKKPQNYALMGGVYYKSWLNSKSATDGTNAVHYYRKYLSLARPDDLFRKQAELLISDIDH